MAEAAGPRRMTLAKACTVTDAALACAVSHQADTKHRPCPDLFTVFVPDGPVTDLDAASALATIWETALTAADVPSQPES